MTLAGFGECLPYHENYVEIDKGQARRLGNSTLKIHCDWGENEHSMSRDISHAGRRNAHRCRCHMTSTFSGTCPSRTGHPPRWVRARMGRDPKTSVSSNRTQSSPRREKICVRHRSGGQQWFPAAQRQSIRLTYMATSPAAALRLRR